MDYNGVYEGYAIAFEAKSVSIDRFDLKNIHSHQIDYLQKVDALGGISFVLIEFRSSKQVRFLQFGITCITLLWAVGREFQKKILMFMRMR
ncbi:Holliday junction resolvase RecU [Fictibacillus solisalsi]|uniref:Holliday junction resolvase RecU n=1 Tax=Fictibacillus solisalsi TaxID=459525 RepID=UPI001FCCF17E|nr:Holliday junction resolvase RecU [Fictibacillus solisalsi]